MMIDRVYYGKPKAKVGFFEYSKKVKKLDDKLREIYNDDTPREECV